MLFGYTEEIDAVSEFKSAILISYLFRSRGSLFRCYIAIYNNFR